MAASDGKVIIDTQLNNKGFNKGVNGLKGQLGGLESVIGKLGKLLAGAFAIGTIVKFGKECVNLGSDVQETQNVVDTAFGDMAYKAEEFASAAIAQFGMSTLAAKKTASNYMAMAKGMGVVPEAASDMALSLAGLSGDVASFYNLEQEEAAQKLAGVFTGEGEALKSIGVVMTQTNLQAYALSKGITKQIEDMTQAEKVALRYGFVMDSLSLAQGDFAKTSDGWANQTRILAMQWQEFMSIIGQALITVLRPVVIVLNQLIGYLITAANALNAFVTSVFGEAESRSEKTASAASTALGAAAAGQEELTSATKETAKAQKKTLAGFDEISKLSGEGSAGGGAESTGSGAAGGGVLTASPSKTAESGTLLEMPNVLSEIGVAIRNVFDSEPIRAFVYAGTTLFGFFREGVLAMFGDIKTNVLLTWGTIQADFQAIFTNLVLLWTRVWSDFSVAVQTWGTPIIDAMRGLFNSVWSAAIEPAIQLVVGAWTDFSGILLDLWNEHGTPLLNNIGEFAYTTIDLFQSIYDNVIEPIVTPLLETLSWLWDEHLSKMVRALGDFIMTLVNGVLEIYNKFIVPLVKELLERLAPAWAFLCSLVIGIVGTIIGVVSDLTTGVLEVLTGIVDFIVGIFTGNWKKAWEGVKSVFKGAWDALVGIVKGVINLIIDVLNSFVAGINKIGFDVPDWVPVIGGMKWGFNIPNIPKLAQGAVIPPNKEFMAVLGDQKSGTNIETPLATMVQAFRQAMAENGGGAQTIVLQIDGREFGRAVKKYGGREDRRIGVSLVGVKG